jgi:hypothetical protein
MQLMLQATIGDCLSFDPFALGPFSSRQRPSALTIWRPEPAWRAKFPLRLDRTGGLANRRII